MLGEQRPSQIVMMHLKRAAKIPEETKIHEDGLRYRSKASGTLFSLAKGVTISCIICGTHRPRSMLKAVRLAGGVTYRCLGPCDSVRQQQ